MKLSKTSDKKVPITVIAPSTNTMVADINISSTNKALNNNGPSVGRFNTTDKIILPDIRKVKDIQGYLLKDSKLNALDTSISPSIQEVLLPSL